MSNEQIAESNFDDPDEIDWELMLSDVSRMLENQPIEMPVYDFRTHRREKFTQTVRAAEFVVLEGLFVLYCQELLDKAIAKIFVNCDEYVRIGRCVKRDTTGRGRTEPEVLRRYLNTTEPMHREIVEPTMANADLIVCGCGDPEVALITVQDYLREKPHFRNPRIERVSASQYRM
jgi:uridine kinase